YLLHLVPQAITPLGQFVEPWSREDKVDIDRSPLPERGEVAHRGPQFGILANHFADFSHLIALTEVAFEGRRGATGQRGVPQSLPGEGSVLTRCEPHVHAGGAWTADAAPAADGREDRCDPLYLPDPRLDNVDHLLHGSDVYPFGGG